MVLCNSVTHEDDVLSKDKDLQIIDKVAAVELIDTRLVYSEVEERLDMTFEDENEILRKTSFSLV